MSFPNSSGSKRLNRIGCLSLSTLIISLAVSTAPPADTKDLGQIIQVIGRVFKPKPPQRSSGGQTKGPEAIISPGVWGASTETAQFPEVWNIRPVVLYDRPQNAQEAPSQIQLINNRSKAVVQTFEVEGQAYAKLAVTKNLELGGSYTIRQINGKTKQMMNSPVRFQVMAEGPTRQALAEKLKALDCEKASETTRGQCIENRMAQFVEAGLWSDALQEVSAFLETSSDWELLKCSILSKWKEADRQPIVVPKPKPKLNKLRAIAAPQ